MKKYQRSRDIVLANYIFNVCTPCNFIIARSVTTTLCCKNDHDYIHIKNIYHIPCTHKRHTILHSHEWVNNVLSIGDSLENTDRVIKRLHITIYFASSSLSWLYCCYMAMSSGESRDVCFMPLSGACGVTHTHTHTHIYIYNDGHHSLPLVHELTIMAKQFKCHNMTPPPPSTGCNAVGMAYTGFTLSTCIFNNTRWIHFIYTHLINQLPTPTVCCQ